MNNSITLAASSDLVGSYHKAFDGIINSQAGTVIFSIANLIAVVLALGLIIGLICKAINRPNALSNMLCSGVLRIVVVIAIIFILCAFQTIIPGLLTLIDWFANAIGEGGTDYLGI